MKNYEKQGNVGGQKWEDIGVEDGFDRKRAMDAVNQELKKRSKEEPKTYKMETTDFFSADNALIDEEAWNEFYETVWGGNTEKDDSYKRKVGDAIRAWNSVPIEERKAYLETGILPSHIDGDTISLLTSARLIDFRRPAGASGRGGGKGGGIPDQIVEKPHSKNNTEDLGTDYPVKNRQQKTKSEPFWKNIFKRHRKQKEVSPSLEPEGGPEEDTTPDEKDVDFQSEPDHEVEPEPSEKYEIIKDIYEEDLTEPERKNIEEQVKSKRVNLRKLLATGLAVLAILLMKPPFETVENAGHARVETSSYSTEQRVETQTRHVPETITQEIVSSEDDPELYHKLAIQKLLQQTDLGGKMKLAEGTDFWESPDHEFGGADNTGVIENESIRPEGEYTVGRLVVLDSKTGEYLGNFYSGDGDSGSLEDLVDKVRQQNPGKEIEVHVCFDDPNTGWSGNIISGDFPVTGIGYVTRDVVVPEHDEEVEVTTDEVVEHRSLGETENLGDEGTIEIVNDDGTSSKINIRHEDGSYYKPGETVVDSNGNVHTIRKLDISKDGKTMRIVWENVMWDAAMLGLAGTGVYLAMRKRRGEDGVEEEQGQSKTEESTNTTEKRTEVRREMMQLSANQLINLVSIFTESAGDKAEEIAVQMAEYAGIEPPEATDDANEQSKSSILDAMTQPEKTVALALLAKRDEATLRHLSDLLGINLDDYAARILGEEKSQNYKHLTK